MIGVKKLLTNLLIITLTTEVNYVSHGFSLSMGLLKVGVPQPWGKSIKNINYVRKAGVRQFISTYNRVKDLKTDEFLWGDEVEYGIFHVDSNKKEIRLSLRAKEVMDTLNAKPRYVREPDHQATKKLISPTKNGRTS